MRRRDAIGYGYLQYGPSGCVALGAAEATQLAPGQHGPVAQLGVAPAAMSSQRALTLTRWEIWAATRMAFHELVQPVKATFVRHCDREDHLKLHGSKSCSQNDLYAVASHCPSDGFVVALTLTSRVDASCSKVSGTLRSAGGTLRKPNLQEAALERHWQQRGAKVVVDGHIPEGNMRCTSSKQ